MVRVRRRVERPGDGDGERDERAHDPPTLIVLHEVNLRVKRRGRRRGIVAARHLSSSGTPDNVPHPRAPPLRLFRARGRRRIRRRRPPDSDVGEVEPRVLAAHEAVRREQLAVVLHAVVDADLVARLRRRARDQRVADRAPSRVVPRPPRVVARVQQGHETVRLAVVRGAGEAAAREFEPDGARPVHRVRPEE